MAHLRENFISFLDRNLSEIGHLVDGNTYNLNFQIKAVPDFDDADTFIEAVALEQKKQNTSSGFNILPYLNERYRKS